MEVTDAYPELASGLDYYVTAEDQWYIAFTRRKIEDHMVSALDLTSRVVPLERVPIDTDVVVEEGVSWTSSSLDNMYVNATATGTTVNTQYSFGSQGIPARDDAGLPLPTEEELKSVEDAAAELLVELTACHANGSDDEKMLAIIKNALHVAAETAEIRHTPKVIENASRELATEVRETLEKIKEEENLDSVVAPGVWKTAIERAQEEIVNANAKRATTKPRKFTIPNDILEDFSPVQDPPSPYTPWKVGDFVPAMSPTIPTVSPTIPTTTSAPYTTTTTTSPHVTLPSTAAPGVIWSTAGTTSPVLSSTLSMKSLSAIDTVISDSYEDLKYGWIKAELIRLATERESAAAVEQKDLDAKAKHETPLRYGVKRVFASLVKNKKTVI